MSITLTQHVYKLILNISFVVKQNVEDCITNQAERERIVTVIIALVSYLFLSV